MTDLQLVADNLNKRRFIARVYETAADAKKDMLSIIGTGSVGIGGSKSIKDLNFYQDLTAQGNTVHCHGFVPPEERAAAREAAMGDDVYLCSANAVTESGLIVNVDGTGNRVAATIFGPKTVILLVGKNKITPTVEAGIERMKTACCGNNARRQGFKTPCAATDRCGDCKTTARMCNVTAILEYPTRHTEHFYVFLVNESLGW